MSSLTFEQLLLNQNDFLVFMKKKKRFQEDDILIFLGRLKLSESVLKMMITISLYLFLKIISICSYLAKKTKLQFIHTEISSLYQHLFFKLLLLRGLLACLDLVKKELNSQPDKTFIIYNLGNLYDTLFKA